MKYINVAIALMIVLYSGFASALIDSRYRDYYDSCVAAPPSYESLVHYLDTQNPEEARIALLEIGLRVTPPVINQLVRKMWLGEIPKDTPMLSQIILHPKVKLGLAEVALSNKLDNLDQYENYIFDAL